MQVQSNKWDLIITPRVAWHKTKIKEIIKFKDLLFLFVKRDFVAQYKQTILGPLWFLIQPALTALTFTIIFGNLAQVSTDGVPQVVFYLAGITIWGYFADTLTKTADTFTTNAAIFGKVYFPRMVVPLSVVLSNMIKLLVQFCLFLVFWGYFLFTTNLIKPNAVILLTPLLIFLLGFLGLGFGIIVTSLTVKYRDLKFLIVFAVQLLMYASPVVYPASIVPARYQTLIWLNPLTSIIETFKFGFLGSGTFSWQWLLYSCAFTVVLMFLGLMVFNRVEKSFTDTV